MRVLGVCTSTSPFKVTELQPYKQQQVHLDVIRRLDYKSDSDISMYTPSVVPSKSTSDTSSFSEPLLKKEYNVETMLKSTIHKIENRPHFYIGVPKDCYFLIKIIHENTGISVPHILMILKKIRLDSKFSELSDEFAITVPYVSRIFNQNLSKIAQVMRPFIVKLNKSGIKRCLPIAFRKNYYNVTSIIDCLEIEVQKPSNVLHQSLTWSEYKLFILFPVHQMD